MGRWLHAPVGDCKALIGDDIATVTQQRRRRFDRDTCTE